MRFGKKKKSANSGRPRGVGGPEQKNQSVTPKSVTPSEVEHTFGNGIVQLRGWKICAGWKKDAGSLDPPEGMRVSDPLFPAFGPLKAGAAWLGGGGLAHSYSNRLLLLFKPPGNYLLP